MLIRINCPNPNCKKQLRIDAKHAGKKISCSGCNQHIRLPSAAELKLPAQVPAAVGGAAFTTGADDQIIDFDMLASEAVNVEKAAQVEETKTVMIEFTCPQCDEPIKIASEHAGKRAPCPSCRRIIAVPKLETDKPRDWREKEVQGPSLAKKEEVKLEGAWGNEAVARVSLEALEEAKALPKIKRKLNVKDYVRYGIYTALVLGGITICWWGWNRYRASSLEGNTLAAVRLSIQDPKTVPEMNAVLRRGMGEWLLQPGNPLDTQKEGLAELRKVTSTVGDPLWNWVLSQDVVEVVGPLISLDPTQEKPLVDLAFLVQLISGVKAGEAREDVVRGLCRSVLLLAKGQPEKLQLAQNLLTTIIKQAIPPTNMPAKTGPASKTNTPGMDYSEQLNALGILAQELLRVDARENAVRLIGKSATTGERMMYKPGMPIPKTFVAAMTALGQPELEIPKSDEAEFELGKMKGHFLGKQDAAGNEILKKKQEGGYSETNLLSYLDLAQQSIDANSLPEALTRLSEAMKIAQIYTQDRNAEWNKRVLAHVKLCYLTAQAGEITLAEERIVKLKLDETPAIGQVARALVARQRQIKTGEVDSLLAGLPANSPAQTLAGYSLAKKQAALEGQRSPSIIDKLGDGPAKQLSALGGLVGAKQSKQ